MTLDLALSRCCPPAAPASGRMGAESGCRHSGPAPRPPCHRVTLPAPCLSFPSSTKKVLVSSGCVLCLCSEFSALVSPAGGGALPAFLAVGADGQAPTPAGAQREEGGGFWLPKVPSLEGALPLPLGPSPPSRLSRASHPAECASSCHTAVQGCTAPARPAPTPCSTHGASRGLGCSLPFHGSSESPLAWYCLSKKFYHFYLFER